MVPGCECDARGEPELACLADTVRLGCSRFTEGDGVEREGVERPLVVLRCGAVDERALRDDESDRVPSLMLSGLRDCVVDRRPRAVAPLLLVRSLLEAQAATRGLGFFKLLALGLLPVFLVAPSAVAVWVDMSHSCAGRVGRVVLAEPPALGLPPNRLEPLLASISSSCALGVLPARGVPARGVESFRGVE